MSVRGFRLLVAGVLLSLVGVGCSSSSNSSSSSASPSLAGAGWVSGPAGSRPAHSGESAPNIVFVLTDDLSWNLVRYMPHVLAMQRAGTTFSRYFVTDSLCCPSRTSIFTGEFPHNSKVFGNVGPEGGFAAFLAHHDEDRTFATTLQDQGYETGIFGKFLNNYWPGSTYEGQRPYVPPGWSAWSVANHFGYEGYGYTLTVGRRLHTYGSAPSDYLTHVLSTKASEFIAASAEAHRPFMAEFSTYAPHGPFVPAPADTTKFANLKAPRGPAFGKAVVNAPKWLRAIPELDQSDHNFIDGTFQKRVQSVQSVDRAIGRLQAQLRQLGIADNTYFVFSSDNGMHLGEHNLRVGKATAFDTDIRVPLIVTGPGVPSNATVSRLTSNIDLASTFDELAGARPPATVDGRSLVPLLHGENPSSWRTAVLVEHHVLKTTEGDPDAQPAEAGDPPPYEAIRTTRYTYIEYVDGEREFYDLKLDPEQLVNRYPTMAKPLRAELHRALTAMEACHGTPECWRASQVFGARG